MTRSPGWGAVVALVLLQGLAAAAERDDSSDQGGQEEESSGDLAKAVQNPIADLISVPFQNNTVYNIGQNERASDVLNIQPVIPIHLSSKLLLITRTSSPSRTSPTSRAPVAAHRGSGTSIQDAGR